MDQVMRFGKGQSLDPLDGAAPTSIMDPEWCGLAWTPWAPLQRDAIRQTAPTLPGVYRVRREGECTPRLTYIGQTGRGLRERLLALAAGVNGKERPYNDPHTAAPHLWLLRQLEGVQLSFSCAPLPGDVTALRGTEDMLLWRHRIETGLSTEANYGRFYPGYARPTNRWIDRKGAGTGGRTPGRTAQPYPAGVTAPDFSVVTPALQGEGSVLQAPWWHRARLPDGASLPDGPAVYCLYERGAEEPAYIGETSGMRARAASHIRAAWPFREPWLAVLPLPADTPKYVLHELESDLLGWHFWQTQRAPLLQYRKAGAVGEGVA